MNRPPNHHETTTTTTTTTTNNSNNRKTRELPNLTECHSCGFRIDTCTNGKTSNNKTMQTLYSEWRIVLLCKKCFSLVQSSRICSYCFKDSSSSSSTTCFRCTQCNHSIHKNCFSKHKSVAPWSYSCFPAQEFSVCVDCWVPKPLARKRGGAVMSGSRVLDANSVAEEKAEVAVRAREIALRKAAVARKAVELANNALGLVVVANKDGDKRRRRRRRRGKECDDDAELAIRLHRAINSSPRMISRRNLCSVNSNCLDIPKNDGEVLCGSRVTSVVSETTSSVSTTNVDCLKRGGGKVYMRKRKCGGGGGNEISSVKWQMKEGEESCSNKLLLNSSVDDNSMNSECNGERCDGKFDRYLFKYRKRKSGSKGIIPNSESKFVCEGLLGECQASAAGLVLNCSNETRTLSNAAFRPCALSLQASASSD